MRLCGSSPSWATRHFVDSRSIFGTARGIRYGTLKPAFLSRCIADERYVCTMRTLSPKDRSATVLDDCWSCTGYALPAGCRFYFDTARSGLHRRLGASPDCNQFDVASSARLRAADSARDEGRADDFRLPAHVCFEPACRPRNAAAWPCTGVSDRGALV